MLVAPSREAGARVFPALPHPHSKKKHVSGGQYVFHCFAPAVTRSCSRSSWPATRHSHARLSAVWRLLSPGLSFKIFSFSSSPLVPQLKVSVYLLVSCCVTEHSRRWLCLCSSAPCLCVSAAQSSPLCPCPCQHLCGNKCKFEVVFPPVTDVFNRFQLCIFFIYQANFFMKRTLLFLVSSFCFIVLPTSTSFSSSLVPGAALGPSSQQQFAFSNHCLSGAH